MSVLKLEIHLFKDYVHLEFDKLNKSFKRIYVLEYICIE